MKKIVVFLGPSLSSQEAQSILDAIYLPPASQSELISAVHIHQPDVIALIDGVFLKCPPTWHKEILYALSQGIAVYGASSMGALRAAETDRFGMVGVGQIYQSYASGELIDDDEVALVHGSADVGYKPLSEPMVNVRATFKLAREQGVLSQELYYQLIQLAKSIYFPERTFAAIFHQAESAGISIESLDPLKTFVGKNYVDLKRQDTILLLKTLCDRFTIPSDNSPSNCASNPANCESNFEVTQTHVFAALYECDRQVQNNNTKISLRRIAECVALEAVDFEDLNFNSLNRMIAQVLAAHVNITVELTEIEQEKRRFRFKHNLEPDINFDQWLENNDLTLNEFEELMQEIAICRRLHQWFLNRQAYQRNVKGLLDELRLLNRYTEWKAIATQQEQLLQSYQIDINTSILHGQTLKDLLLDHLEATNSRIPPIPFEDWLFERGFLNRYCLEVALMRAKAARDIGADANRQQS